MKDVKHVMMVPDNAVRNFFYTLLLLEKQSVILKLFLSVMQK